MSSSPTPSYHLCPDFSIAPPTKGHLDLGSILMSIDVYGVSFPLNLGSHIEVPRELIYPKISPESYNNRRDGTGDTLVESDWDVKSGFTRTIGQLRAVEASLWGKIASGVGGKLGWMRERSNDETLTIEKILTRYFVPTNEYIDSSLKVPNVAAFINRPGKKKPLYIITGLKIAVGASLSKTKSIKTTIGGKGGASEPQIGIGGGPRADYTRQNTANVGFEGSSDFVLGFRVRKVSWKDNMRIETDKVAGSTFEDGAGQGGDKVGILEDAVVIDDFGVEEAVGDKWFIIEEEVDGIEPSNWVLP